jgi:hypothetical protein
MWFISTLSVVGIVVVVLISIAFDFWCKIREKKRSAQYLKTIVLSIAHPKSPAKAD